MECPYCGRELDCVDHYGTSRSEYYYGTGLKATIEINEDTLNMLSGALNLPPLYDEDYGVDEDQLSYAIKLMVELCAD